MALELTEIQAQVLQLLRGRVDRGEAAPTHRDLCAEFGWASTATARDHLRALARKGYVELSGGHRRLRLLEDRPRASSVPIVGRVKAGIPVESTQETTKHIPVPAEWTKQGTYFAVRVAGDSMRDAGILEGDHVIIRQQSTASDGDIVVATVDGETTLKRLNFRGRRTQLRPENSRYRAIDVRSDSADIQGVVVGLLRDYR